MAIDEGERAELMAEIDKKLNGMVKAVTEKVSAKVAEQLSKVVEDGVASKLAEAQKAQQAEAQKPNPEAEERKTLTQRVKELEKERDDAREATKQERANASFRKEWANAKFAPDLAEDHMAALEKSKRLIVDDAGNLRVRDPQRAPEETQPTLAEYVTTLAKSDRGRLYMPPPPTKGGGIFPRTEANGVQRPVNVGALDSVFGGETLE